MGTPYGRANYCLNTARQSYAPDLTPIGNNVRLSADTWDGQLSAPRPGGRTGVFKPLLQSRPQRRRIGPLVFGGAGILGYRG